ncbi:MAG: hypothetical protein QM788_05370 [Roseateles sp.]|uniref:hypothetical protein n=1 Tax=Roseateles sp. TaxID=1971397 RepID=UPI0039E9E055
MSGHFDDDMVQCADCWNRHPDTARVPKAWPGCGGVNVLTCPHCGCEEFYELPSGHAPAPASTPPKAPIQIGPLDV